jgi:hypothetical protein
LHEFATSLSENIAHTAGRVKTLPYMIFLEKCTLEKSP